MGASNPRLVSSIGEEEETPERVRLQATVLSSTFSLPLPPPAPVALRRTWLLPSVDLPVLTVRVGSFGNPFVDRGRGLQI